MAASGQPSIDTVVLAGLKRRLSEEASRVSAQRYQSGQFLLREPSEADFGTPQRTTSEQALIRAHGSCAQDTVDFLGNVESGMRRISALIDHSIRTMTETDEQNARAITQATDELGDGPSLGGER